MNINRKHLEILLHILFWLFYISAINVDWSQSWFDRTIRPRTPAPLSVLIFPIYFYANAFWLMPKFFNKANWIKYIIFSVLIFILPEIIRSMAHCSFNPNSNLADEIFSRDSFLFGAPSSFFIALNTSFIYRLSKDWFANKAKIKELSSKYNSKVNAPAYQNISLLTDEETETLSQRLQEKMEIDKLYLNSNLSLRELAESINSSEKKLSFLLNQKKDINFNDYLNNFRIDTFKKEVAKSENEKLSIVGIAMNCGFKSKSSFYRAFKNSVGISPSQFLKELKKNQ